MRVAPGRSPVRADDRGARCDGASSPRTLGPSTPARSTSSESVSGDPTETASVWRPAEGRTYSRSCPRLPRARSLGRLHASSLRGRTIESYMRATSRDRNRTSRVAAILIGIRRRDHIDPARPATPRRKNRGASRRRGRRRPRSTAGGSGALVGRGDSRRDGKSSVRTRCCRRMGTALSRRSPSISKTTNPPHRSTEHDAQVCRGVAEVACRPGQDGSVTIDHALCSKRTTYALQRVRTIPAALGKEAAPGLRRARRHAVGDVSNLGHRSDRVRPQRTRSKRWPQ